MQRFTLLSYLFGQIFHSLVSLQVDPIFQFLDGKVLNCQVTSVVKFDSKIICFNLPEGKTRSPLHQLFQPYLLFAEASLPE